MAIHHGVFPVAVIRMPVPRATNMREMSTVKSCPYSSHPWINAQKSFTTVLLSTPRHDLIVLVAGAACSLPQFALQILGGGVLQHDELRTKLGQTRPEGS